ncbi:MAG: hypothetical protein V4476_10590 [Pseudomonadota bacterium]
MLISKHLFYLSGDQLCAYLWQGGRLSGGELFSNDHAGVERFLDYVDSHGVLPAYLLADLIEEDFQRVQLPHVGGASGRKLLQRRLLQQYRETPYRHAEVQGREHGGRRDDIVLLAALTNVAAVQPWVKALEQLKMPLAGLYTTTLLSAELVRKLGLRDEHLLLITQHSAGWRQSYFQHGQLKFSRLTPAIDRDNRPIDIGAETAKTQQFLNSVRLLGRGAVLHAVVLAPAAATAALDAQCANGPETAFRFIALRAAATAMGLRSDDSAVAELGARVAEPLLLAQLGRQAPAGHYALGAMRRYYLLWRTRLTLYVASAGLGLCSLVWLGANLWQTQTADAASARLLAEAGQYDQRYRAVMAAMPPRVTTTANMRAAVNVERMLATQAPSPLAMVAMVSAALEQSPQIRLLQLDWKVSLPGAVPAAGQDETQAVPISSLLAGIPGRPPQALLVEAEIVADQDDYRGAVDSMNHFAQQLARQPHLTVAIDKPPLDTRSSVKLSGKAGPATVEARAKFSLNLVWNP